MMQFDVTNSHEENQGDRKFSFSVASLVSLPNETGNQEHAFPSNGKGRYKYNENTRQHVVYVLFCFIL